MEIRRFVSSNLPSICPRLTLALGNFDGMHRGHNALLQAAKEKAEGASGVLLFEHFPFKDGRPLMDLEQKLSVASRLGLDFAYVLEEDPGFFLLSKDAFVDSFLLPLGVNKAVVGKDYRFGAGAKGDVSFLSSRLETLIVDEVKWGEQKISTSRIKEALAAGDIAGAEALLGHSYEIRGKVSEGRHIGRSIGFPTLNLENEANLFLPKDGVYGGFVYLLGIPYPALINVGKNPTVGGFSSSRLEAHLIGYQGDAYGKTAYVSFAAYLRPERVFPSLSELEKQIEADKESFLAQLEKER